MQNKRETRFLYHWKSISEYRVFPHIFEEILGRMDPHAITCTFFDGLCLLRPRFVQQRLTRSCGSTLRSLLPTHWPWRFGYRLLASFPHGLWLKRAMVLSVVKPLSVISVRGFQEDTIGTMVNQRFKPLLQWQWWRCSTDGSIQWYPNLRSGSIVTGMSM